MSEITFEEFLKLPEEEKSEKYKELSNHDRFLARMSFTGGAVATGEKFDMSKEDNTWLEEEEKNGKKIVKSFMNKEEN